MADRSYENTPYPVWAFPQTHPDRLAAIGTLLGLQPPPVQHCRVLELGCASGGNLIPMAAAFPDSEFIGIDLSAAQIDEGQAMVEALGLKNISLRVFDIDDVDSRFGIFDYLIAHGVYSWVPPHTRDNVMAICRDHLAPNGLAYISYNVYPGWHLWQVARGITTFHLHTQQEDDQVSREAVNILEDLSGALSAHAVDPSASLLNVYAALLNVSREKYAWRWATTPEVLVHDDLSVYNQPVYFHEFADHAARYGLQYVSEAELKMVTLNEFPPEIHALLAGYSKTLIQFEQYMDFARGRPFRQTILTHQAAEVGALDPNRIRSLRISAPNIPQALSVHATLQSPLSEAAFALLVEGQPRCFTFLELLTAAAERSGLPINPETEAALLEDLLNAVCTRSDLLELHTCIPPCTAEITNRPRASQLSRLQAEQNKFVNNTWNREYRLTPIGQRLLPLLDGTRTLDDLRDHLQSLGEAPTDLEGILESFRRIGILEESRG